MTVLQCVYTWLILQLCGLLARVVPSETQFRAQNAEPRLCGVIAGIHAVNLDPSGNCAPLQMEDDTGLKYVATLLSFLILFRFNQLYGRIVAVRHTSYDIMSTRMYPSEASPAVHGFKIIAGNIIYGRLASP